MPYLQNEQTRTQAEIQRAEADVANLTSQVAAQQQVLANAQAQVNAARGKLADAQAQRPGLEAAAAAADQRVAGLDSQITQHLADEPDRVITGNGKPVPNPEWKLWKKRLDELTKQRDGAQANASLAHSRLNDLNAAIARATVELQTAQAQAAQATATLEQLNQALAAARDRAVAAHQRLDDLRGLSAEIDREPLDRPALEKAAAELSARVIELEDAYNAARVASAKADAVLASLIARRDQLTAALADVNNQLPTANEQVGVADSAAAALAQQIDDQISGGP